jgi:hypothetical protein
LRIVFGEKYKTVSEHFSEAVVVNKYLIGCKIVKNEKRRVIVSLFGSIPCFVGLVIWFHLLQNCMVIPFFILGCYFVIKNQNRNNQNFDGGSLYNRQQVLLRMTGGEYLL